VGFVLQCNEGTLEFLQYENLTLASEKQVKYKNVTLLTIKYIQKYIFISSLLAWK